jgi:hypothetical protein
MTTLTLVPPIEGRDDEFALVHEAIETAAERHRADCPDDSDLRRFGTSAYALAIIAVLQLSDVTGFPVDEILADLERSI